MIYFWVALGGAIGTLGRFCISSVVASQIGETFPLGTLIINVTGSFIIGFFATISDTEGTLLVGREMRAFVTIGICGGYTTFSSFSLQTLNLARDGQWFLAAVNIIASNVGCLLAVWLGYVCAMALRR